MRWVQYFVESINGVFSSAVENTGRWATSSGALAGLSLSHIDTIISVIAGLVAIAAGIVTIIAGYHKFKHYKDKDDE